MSKASRKPAAKRKKTAKKDRPASSQSKKAKAAPLTLNAPLRPSPVLASPVELNDKPSFKIDIDGIHGGTVLGDLMVVFPRTREVLKKYGLNLEVDEAGDIYMSLEAFAALKGLKTESIIQELEAASREPSPLPPAHPITIQTVA